MRAQRAFAFVAMLFAWAPLAAAERLEELRLMGAESLGSKRIVSEGEWATDLVDALDLSRVLPDDPRPSELFGLLCADQAELVTDVGGRRVPGRAAFRVAVDAPRPRQVGEPVRVVVNVPATALYLLFIEGSGAQRWSVDQKPVGHIDASSLGVAHVPALIPLQRGPHELSAFTTSGSRIDRIELAAYRPLCVAPADGWDSDRPLTFGAKARTMVRALGFERRLPPDGDPIVIEGERFDKASEWGGRTNRPLATPASSDSWATAIGSPAEFSYRTRLKKPGVFSLQVRVRGPEPQVWSIDGRYRLVLHPESGWGDFAWAHVVTLPLSAGEHVIRALIARESGIDLLRLVRHKAEDSDYVDLLEEVGFAEGAPHALVTADDVYANLTHPTFAALAGNFLTPFANPGDLLFLVEDELETLYSRPLSPVLPPEL